MYSLISGVGIFFIGAGVTCYHGFLGLLHPHAIGNVPVVNIYPELGQSFSLSLFFSLSRRLF